ncbi:TRAP transporter small permease [Rhodovarius crocodyli]|uniref:TRAP transporter small permease protein n=1 Tax=Rhodovarius crocodyli TaxID=1979269 RepID=A0A437MFB2_9PROT|nr:TRAP transporter small permease subunit [Rhodovarius crocodyli]RVT96351.1 TRAP transporter small permease [Rhodovarius crocodyli]
MQALARWLAILGGVVLIAASVLTVVSGLSRWWTSQPVRGDVELVSVAAGIAVMAAMPWGTARGSHIMVDSFTGWLPASVTGFIDRFWRFIWIQAFALLAWRMALGAQEAIRNGEQTMGLLGVPYGYAVAFGAFCFGLSALLSFKDSQ